MYNMYAGRTASTHPHVLSSDLTSCFLLDKEDPV
jgi:hypothetical protein